MKIGQYLAKIWTTVVSPFLTHGVQVFLCFTCVSSAFNFTTASSCFTIHYASSIHQSIHHSINQQASVGQSVGWGDQWRLWLRVCVSVRLSALKKENGLSYQHQTRCTHTLRLSLGMHWPGGQKVKGQGHKREAEGQKRHTASACSWSMASLSMSTSVSSDFLINSGSRATSSTFMLSIKTFVSRSFVRPFLTRSRAPSNCLYTRTCGRFNMAKRKIQRTL